MSYFVKVIPPAGRARVHEAECRHCLDFVGQANPDKDANAKMLGATGRNTRAEKITPERRKYAKTR